MQAVVYRGPRDLRLETLPVPRIGPNELLVKVAVCGVCPTDIKKMHYGTVPPPRVFGHETAGTIVRTGARVRGFRVGERVSLHHHIPCMDCHFCRHQAFAQCLTYKRTGITAGFEPAGGGYAEYVRVLPFVFPGVIKIPARNTFQEGAMLEPVNTVLKAIRRLNLLAGDNVLVVGVGPIGLMFTRLLALEKMRVFASDLFPSRLRLAKKFGASVVLNGNDPKFAGAVRRSGGKQGLDAAIICAPVDAAVQQAQELVNGAGKILLFAHTKRGAKMPIDLAAICVDEKDLIGSYSADVTLQKEVARLVFSGRMPVRELITHRFPLAQTAAAVDLAAQPTPESLKVVVDQTLSGRRL
jgi:L-iditol 2-dehydrogenase